MKKKNLPCGRPAPERPLLSESALQALQLQLKAYLEKAGLRYSEQRWQIARTILTAAHHYSAQSLVKTVLKEFPEIGAATVYRNIKVLCDARIMRETLVDLDGNAVYEPFAAEHHDHIVCTDCGEIFEFSDEKIETLQDEVLSVLEFIPLRHRHILYAKCKFLGGAAS